MSTVYIVNNTGNTLSFAIQPGTLNGPSGVQQNTDLRLHGMGTVLWGEGVNENFLRLTESFACPESVSTPGSPMDEVELAQPGFGINTPIEGQQWYNIDQQKLFVYNGTDWISAGGAAVGALAGLSDAIGTVGKASGTGVLLTVGIIIRLYDTYNLSLNRWG